MDFIVQTFQQVPDWLIYLLLATFLLLESSGVPVFNTVLLLLTGALAAMGRLNPVILMLASVLGSTLGACLAYILGRRYGEALLFRLTHLLHINASKVRLAQSWFQRAGGRMIFLSRILPYIRPFACFPAGISAMPFGRFFLCALTGSMIWCVTFLMVGWQLGPRWQLAVDLMRLYTIPVMIGLVLVLVAFFFARRALIRLVKKHLMESGEELEQDRDLLGV